MYYHLEWMVVKPFESNIMYQIGVFSDPHIISTEEEMIESTPDHLWLHGCDLRPLDAIFKTFLNKHVESAVVFVKMEELTNIRSNMTQSSECLLAPMITKELQASMHEDHLIIWPFQETMILLVARDNSESFEMDLMKQLDEVFNNLNFVFSSEKRISYSAGLAYFPDHEQSVYKLIRHALAASEAIPAKSHIRYQIYQKDMVDLAQLNRIMHEELAHAFERKEFYVVYQMQYKTSDNKPTGVEALIRWKNDKLDVVSPDLFIPVLQESNLVKQLGLYVLEQVLEDFEGVASQLPEDFKISINLTSDEMLDERILKEIVFLIRQSSMAERQFCFEITETTLIKNLKVANEAINILHDNHMITAIDDFGTGFSSLSYLKTLKTDKLKIDRLFIKDYPHIDDGTIFKGIIGIANDLKLNVIVEGIETPEQLAFIRALDCHEYQGFITSRPESFETCIERLLGK